MADEQKLIPVERVRNAFRRMTQRNRLLKQEIELRDAKIAALTEIIAVYRDSLAAMQSRDQLAALINQVETKQLIKGKQP